MTLKTALASLVSLAAVVMACSAEESATDKICTPEAYVFCRCQDREEGTKQCNAEGNAFADCLPCDGSGSGGEGSGGTDGLGGGYGEDDDEDEGPPPTQKAEENPDAGEPTPGDPDASVPPEEPEEPVGGGEEPVGGGEDVPDDGPKREGMRSDKESKPTGYAPKALHCQPLENIAPRIEVQKIADEPGEARGGKPVDGLYIQSWMIQFTGSKGASGPTKHYSRQTLEIDGDVGRYVFEDDDGKKAAGGFRLTREGDTKVDVAYECPAAPPKNLAYDATSTTIIIYDPPFARVFIRQTGEEK